MSKIQVLDQITIDKIAAGEVVERPSSVVKELVENAIDAEATAVTVELKEGGISFIRVADNGNGIEKDQVRSAFLRHSTSKIRNVEDLLHIHSLGFRGEALSSIAAVSQVELLTKTKNSMYGTKYLISGGKEERLEDAGVPDGTTFFVRQLFYNTPARRKFLKTAMTEASHVGELIMRLALSHPEVSFQFINNGQSKIHTSGNGNLKDVIYNIYGRDVTTNLIPVKFEKNGLKITGFIGKPIISRGNRNFENYFINHRYVKSNIVFKAIEDAYKDYSMQHKFPFVVLHFDIDGEKVDVNVHPTKMDVRFQNQQEVYNLIYEAVNTSLHRMELIPEVTLEKTRPETSIPEKTINQERMSVVNKTIPVNEMSKKAEIPSQQPKMTVAQESKVIEKLDENEKLDYFMKQMKQRVKSYHEQNSQAEVTNRNDIFKPTQSVERIREKTEFQRKTNIAVENKQEEKPKQLDLFEEKLLDRNVKAEFKVVGQVFDTYWIIEFKDNMYIIDQHAAHERILYENTLKEMKTRTFTSQMISPPIVLNLTMQEQELLNTYKEQFTRIGFEFEEFGQGSYTVRAVPDNLFSIAKKDLLIEMLDQLSDELSRNLSAELIDEKIASLSCKAAVKGNMKLSAAEVENIIGQLLLLENPYHCPHGRPTIVAMSKRELEKKFKRIL